jgi:hypothetical protein
MKRTGFVAAIAALTLAQSLAYAQILDLPDPGEVTGSGSGSVATAPAVENQLAGSASITNITRKTGGEAYVVKFNNPQALQSLDLRVMSYRLQIHSVTLITTSGQRTEIQTLSGMPVLSVDSVTSSGALETSESIDSVEFILESYGGNSQLVVTALGQSQVPQMTASMLSPSTIDSGGGSGGFDEGGGFGSGLSNGGGDLNSGNGEWKDAGSISLDTNKGSAGNVSGVVMTNSQCTASGFCVNDRVLVPNVGFGYIVAIGTQESVYVQMDGTAKGVAYSSKNIYRVVLCTSNGICNAQTVSFNGLKVGAVAAVLENGVVYVSEFSTGQYYAIQKEQIGVQVGCYINVCQGAKVSYLGGGRRYVAEKVFSNGAVVISQKKRFGKKETFIVRASDLY